MPGTVTVRPMKGVEVVRDSPPRRTAFLTLGTYVLFIALLPLAAWSGHGTEADGMLKALITLAAVFGWIVYAVIGFSWKK